jgi:hypothetical protein
VTTIVAIAVLAGGMYITFAKPELVSISLTALLAGFLLSQIGIYFTNRWGRRPRPDEQIDSALKGFSSQYSLYHYVTPAAHVLVGPAGVWVLIPKSQSGTIVYQKGRWRQKGGGILRLYLKVFAQESIGRPDLEIASQTKALARYLEEITSGIEIPPIQAALVFSHPNVKLQADEAPHPTLHAKKVKDNLRKVARSKPVSLDTIAALQGAIQK